MPDLSNIAVGSLPQWLLLLVVVLGFIRWLWPWRADEMRKLRAELKECEADCDRRIKKLEADLWGEKRQRVSEQISFIHVILDSVDAPQLQTMLSGLERVQANMRLKQKLDVSGE